MEAGMNSKTFLFKPQFLEFCGESALGVKLHRFQAMIRDIVKSPYDCIFIDAPTASGKTFSFLLPTGCNYLTVRRVKTLIVSPTNLLIEQTYSDIVGKITENSELRDINITKITGKSLVGLTLHERAKKIRRDFVINDIIISNPDIIALFLTGFYDINYDEHREKEFTRNRSTEDIFSELNVVIFDEYHVYSEEELGKIAALIYLSKLIHNIPKIVFTSATPQNKLKELLSKLGLNCADYHESSFPDEIPESRKIRGEVSLTVTDQPIMEALDYCIDDASKVLYLFDHKIDAEISREKLIKMGLDSKYIEDLSGFSNRATSKQNPSGSEKCILATNAAEQGLNLDVSRSHIEPGLYIENLTQRYGRIGRQGKSGFITVHFRTPFVERIPDNILDFQDLISNLADSFFKKEIYLSRIKRHFAAFLALCTIKDARHILGPQIHELIIHLRDQQILEIYEALLSFNKTVTDLCKLDDPDPSDLKDLSKWWHNFLISIGFFRGQSMTVPVGLERESRLMTTSEDIIWVKKWCLTEVIGSGKDSIYLIKSFKEIPSTVEIHFATPADKISVSERELLDRERFIEIYFKKISHFLEIAFDDAGIISQKTLHNLAAALKIIYPGMLMPLEVEYVSKSQII